MGLEISASDFRARIFVTWATHYCGHCGVPLFDSSEENFRRHECPLEAGDFLPEADDE